MIGQTISHYRILEKLGEGGMGEVYRAHDTKLDREVALKILPEELTQDSDRRLRFQREARLLASFSHPHIAAIHSIEEDRDRHFFVLELITGEDLSERLSRGPLPLPEALAVALQIAAALEAAHENGIIHRDLKPHNVKLTPDGQVKVLDFGLARAFLGEIPQDVETEAAGSLTVVLEATTPGMILGSPAYMSPEQARGEVVDKRTDIWAFGCVLYAMLTGQPAFSGDTASDIMAAVLTSEPYWNELPADLPPTAVRLLRRCLQKDTRERLHDIADARIEIVEVLSELEADDVPTSAAMSGAIPVVNDRTSPVRGWNRKVPIWAAILGCLAVAVLAILLFERPPAPRIPVRLKTLTFSGRDWSPSASPDGSLIAFTSSRDGVTRIWLKQVRGGGEEPLTDGYDDLPRFSPDGSQILFIRGEDGKRNLYRTTVVGGQPRKLIDDVLEADWSPDGTRVVFLRGTPVGSGNMVILGTAEVQTGSERQLAQIENRLCCAVRWSPDGSWIAVNEASLTGNVADESTIDLVDAETGELQRLSLTDWNGPYTAIEWLPRGKSFLVGQAADLLAHVSSSMGQIMQYDLESGTCHPLFWSSVRLPRYGWDATALTILDANRVVLDDLNTWAELHEVSLADANDAPSLRVLTKGLGQDRQPAFSPDARHVIFSSNRSGNVDLWILEMATREVRQLTDDPADDWDPAFTPDGKHVLWSSSRSGNMEIWMAAADGSRARQVTKDGVNAENPTMTRDGQWIVYTSSNDENLGVWRIHPDGSNATRLSAGSFVLAEVSPDGRYALFAQMLVQSARILVVTIENGEMVPFEIMVPASVSSRDVLVGRARWTVDGRAILYIGEDEQGRSGVYAQDFVPGLDTSESRRSVVGFSLEYVTESLGLSPDGKSLVISARFDRQSLKLAENVGLQGWE